MYCHACGREVGVGDADRGLALGDAGGVYCPSCADDLGHGPD
jgi:hypothetical protein